MATTPAPVRVRIAIYRGDPIDAQPYRHTGLSFLFADKSSPPLFIHAVGSPREYEVHTNQDYNPEDDPQLAKLVCLGELRCPLTKLRLVKFALVSQPDNRSWEWNCHCWVEDVSRRMWHENWIDEVTYRDGVDGMVEATLEAKEEA